MLHTHGICLSKVMWHPCLSEPLGVVDKFVGRKLPFIGITEIVEALRVKRVITIDVYDRVVRIDVDDMVLA